MQLKTFKYWFSPYVVTKNTRNQRCVVDLDKESLKKMFPNLARELDFEESRIAVNSVRTDPGAGEEAASKQRYASYMPDVVDFIRRCDNEKQAEEIIAFMEKRGEIERPCAQRIRKQLKEKGVRSFGPKKEEGYYLNHGEV